MCDLPLHVCPRHMCMWCLGTPKNPWTTPRCQRPCHRLQYLPCSIHGTGVAPPPRSRGARCTGPRALEAQHLPTGDRQGHVFRVLRRGELSCLGRREIRCFKCEPDSGVSRSGLVFVLQPCRTLCFSVSCFSVLIRDRSRTSVSDRVGPTVFTSTWAARDNLVCRVLQWAWLLSVSLGSEMKISRHHRW